MKRFIAALLLLPALALADPYDIIMTQRNSDDTGQLIRLVTKPAGTANGLLGYSGALQLPFFFGIGPSLSLTAGVLDAAAPTWATLSGKPTTLAGYGITDGATTTALVSGLATKFNNPAGTTAQYVRGDGSLATLPAGGSGTVTSITAGAGLAGGTITTSGTVSMPNAGTPGTYGSITTDAQGRVTAGTNRSQAAATRTLNTIFQISATRDADARYSVQCTITANITGGQNCDVVLEIASDSGFTANVQTVGIVGTGQTYTLAVALQGVQPQTAQVTGWVPAGYYVRLRTVQNTGAPTFSYRGGQEILQ